MLARCEGQSRGAPAAVNLLPEATWGSVLATQPQPGAGVASVALGVQEPTSYSVPHPQLQGGDKKSGGASAMIQLLDPN